MIQCSVFVTMFFIGMLLFPYRKLSLVRFVLFLNE